MTNQQLQRKNRKRIVRLGRHVLAHTILTSLALIGGALLITTPGLAQVTRLLPGSPRGTRAVGRALENLHLKGYVTISGTRGARKAHLTDRGRREAFLLSLSPKHIDRARWDKTWFMVSFDIPIEQAHARKSFRGKLKDLGFVQYHKSLYIHPHGHESELDFLTLYYEVPHCVTYFYAADLKNDTALRKRFRL